MPFPRTIQSLSKDILINTVWSWGPINHDALTTQLKLGKNGRIEDYDHTNESFWKINDDGVLEFYSRDNVLSWKFSSIFENDKNFFLISLPCRDLNWDQFFCLKGRKNTVALKNNIALPPEFDFKNLVLIENSKISKFLQKGEGIRLVIWDLDDTFWQGTLSEGEVTPIQKTIEIVKTLNSRGIVNAICSRNTFEDTKQRLEHLGVWDDFVFPRIAWAPKGPLIQDIIEKIQLRPETVLFIDDNVTNLNEAKHFVPAINVAEPDIIATLLDDPRLAGKPDPDLSRLKRYQVLETKHNDMSAHGGNNEEFLRKSDIRVSFHSDVEGEFARIHDLVNRTNQLNFTKNRWPEDIEEARLCFKEELEADFDTDVGYVKVADAYGNYGICGFYLSRKNEFLHFLFSCRTMNMGVEQFVWSRLGRKHIHVQGKVGAELTNPTVNWITVVDDVDDSSAKSSNTKKKTVCIRGACDLMMTSNFLRTRVDTIEEFNYPYEGWEIVTTPRTVYVAGEDLKDQRNREIAALFPAMPPHRFDTDILAETAEAYVLSFSQESFHGLYQSKTTGMIIPMGNTSLPWYYMPGGVAWDPYAKNDYTKLTYEEVLSYGVNTGFTQEQWNFFREEFSFFGGFNEDLFKHDIEYIFNRLKAAGKTVIVLGLNPDIGRDVDLLGFFKNINTIVQPIVEKYKFHYIKMENFVKSEADLANDGAFGGAHFDRVVYKNISDTILNLIR